MKKVENHCSSGFTVHKNSEVRAKIRKGCDIDPKCRQSPKRTHKSRKF